MLFRSVIGIVLVIVLAIFVALFDMILPIIVKGQFDDLCRNYLLLSESQNGLYDEDILKLKVALEELGINDLTVTAQEKHEVTRGEMHAFEVLGVYRYYRMQSIFKREQIELPFKFKGDFLARKIVQ